MILNKASINVLNQLGDLLQLLSNEEFTRQLDHLNRHTLGQHVRHIMEFFICLKNAYFTGYLNYDERDHDKTLESDRVLAISVNQEIIQFLTITHQDRSLDFETDYSKEGRERLALVTTFYREMAYNIEHAVHHMALIKIGLKEINPHIVLPDDFGVAVSTLRHKKEISTGN